MSTLWQSTSSAQTLCSQFGTLPASDNSFVWGNATTDVLSSNLSAQAYSNKVIHLNGNLIINSPNFSLTNCTVRVATGKKIIINQSKNLELNSCKIFCCTNFWAGIEQLKYSKIRLTSSQIEDAVNALKTNEECFGFISNNFFNRNQMSCISITPTVSTNYYDYNITGSNRFACSSAINGTLNDRTQSGIIFKNAYSIYAIGYGGNNTVYCQFSNLQNGIYATNSRFSVSKCRFDNIISLTPFTFENTSGYAIHTTGGSVSVSGFGNSAFSIASFENCQGGIYLKNSRFNIQDNYFKNMLFLGITGDVESITVSLNIPNKIDKNYIVINRTNSNNIPSAGIRLKRGGNIEITNNTINIKSSFATDGMYLYTESLQNYYGLKISNNIISSNSVTGANSSKAIHITTGAAGNQVVNVLSNTINMDMTSTYGISLAGGLNSNRKITIAGNGINGAASFNPSNPTNAAISSAACAEVYYCQNNVNNTNYEVTFIYNNMPSVLKHTSFGSHQIGLNYDYEAKTGLQYFGGNSWNGTYSTAGSKYMGENINGDIYKVDPNDGINLWPAVRIPSIGWFFSEEGDTPNCIGGTLETTVQEAETKIAEGTYDFSTETAATIAGMKRNLYGKLAGDALLRNSDITLKNFYDNYDDLPGKDFQTVLSGLQNAFAVSSQDMNALTTLLSEMSTLEAQILTLQNQINQNPTSSSISQRNSLLTTLQDKKNQYNTIENTIKALRQNALLSFRDFNSAIYASQVYDVYTKAVLDAVLCSYLGLSLSKEQIDMLRTAAGDCVNTGGNAVLAAINFLPDEEQAPYWEAVFTASTCPKNNSERGTFLQSRNNLLTFPNPADDHLTIHYPELPIENITHLGIYDITGKVLLEEVLLPTKGSIEMDVHKLPEGMYFVKLRNDSRYIQTTRFVIAR